MESFWKKLEEEMGFEISESDRSQILHKGVLQFINNDLRYWEVKGLKYPSKPEAFREALLRKIAKVHFKGDEDDTDNSEGNST